ncbi:MAG TPA: hypothetical protein VN451_02305 [Chitinophagaceae bacterium]|nr:hypothetical protein [Chitinophagaceae bacterium]
MKNGMSRIKSSNTKPDSGVLHSLRVGPKTFYLHSMADVHNKKTRSYNMSRIKSANTKPELLLRKFLHANGFRYSLYKKTLPGKPDIVLPKYKTVIFVHGCFWHGNYNKC